MKRISIVYIGLALVVVVLLMAACTAQTPASAPDPTATPTTVPTVTTAPSPTVTPVPTVVSADPPAPAEAFNLTTIDLPSTIPASALTFADIPGNLATGDPAPDFSTMLMGETPFALSAQRGHPVLVIPTAAGCGECMITLGELADAYPAYRDRDIQVVVLDLFPGSSPDVWREMVDYFGEPSFQWGAASDQFIEEYDVATLGMIFLIDRDGNLVFRSERPIPADDFRRLLNMATG